MNYQIPSRVGLPAKSIKAGGETYSPQEVRALLQKLASLGINQDKIIAQITPQEAAVLKGLGGSGEINPRTGLLSFDDDGGGGDSGSEGGSGNDSGSDSDSGGGWGGGWGGSELGGAGGEMGGANWGGGPEGSQADGTTDGTTGGQTDGGDEGDDEADDEVNPNLDEYGRDMRDVYGADYIGSLAGVTGSPGDPTSGANIFGTRDEDTEDYSEFDDFMAVSKDDPLVDTILEQTQGLTRDEALAMAEIISNSMQEGSPVSLSQAAEMAGIIGGAPSQDTAYGDLGYGPGPAGYAGVFTGGSPGVSGAGIGALGETGAGAFGLSGVQGQSEYGNLGNISGLAESAYGSLGSGPGPAGYASAWNSDTGVSGQGVGALGQTEAGQFGLSGVQGVSSTYGGLTNAGLSSLTGEAPAGTFPAGDVAGTTGLLTMGTEPGFVPGTAPTVSDIYGPPVYMPTTVDTSPVVTAPVVTITKPATPVTPPTIEVAPVVPVTPVVPVKPVVEGETTGPTVEELLIPGGDGGEQWIRPTTLVDDVVAPKTTTPATSTATATTPKTVIPKDQARAIVEAIVGRRRTPYLQSYYTDGYNPEGLKFAMGGPVVQSSFPVTAYTDGQGPVGAIAAPPALTGYQAAGYDNVVGSPMAPAPAAAAPSLFGGGPLSAARNTNAMPVQSQISQNPNVASSLGYGPLARLT